MDRGDYRRHLSFANGSLKELETQLLIAGRLNYITRDDIRSPWELSQDIGKMLNRLMAALSCDSDTRHPTPETRNPNDAQRTR